MIIGRLGPMTAQRLRHAGGRPRRPPRSYLSTGAHKATGPDGVSRQGLVQGETTRTTQVGSAAFLSKCLVTLSVVARTGVNQPLWRRRATAPNPMSADPSSISVPGSGIACSWKSVSLRATTPSPSASWKSLTAQKVARADQINLAITSGIAACGGRAHRASATMSRPVLFWITFRS